MPTRSAALTVQTPVTMTLANTEYSFVLPVNTVRWGMKSRGGNAFRFATVTGKVATPTDPYVTVAAGQIFNSAELEPLAPGDGLAGQTIYVGTDTAGDVIEVWTYLHADNTY